MKTTGRTTRTQRRRRGHRDDDEDTEATRTAERRQQGHGDDEDDRDDEDTKTLSRAQSEQIGEVVDGPDDGMKRPVLDGVQYDYVFVVDIGDGEPVRKLPYNRSGSISHVDRSIPPKGLLLVTHELSSVNTAPGPHSRGSTLRAFSVGDKEVDLLLPGTARLRVQLGVNMPAQANHKVSQDVSGSTEVELFEVYDVVLYLGIIDILQEYNVRKKIEHAYKSIRHDPMSISVADPKFYSKRFFNFLEKLFPADT